MKFSIFPSASLRAGNSQSSKIKVLLFLIVIIAAVLRLWQLGNVPIAPDWDEAALGYNAYSISKTGHDEYGKFLPVVLRSFDDYKPALYAYLIIPLIPIFDLNAFSVRLPSALFGIFTVFAVFFLIRELFRNYKYKDYLALLTSFLLAISPWHIQVSRVAFETNVGLSFNVFAALFFLKGLKKPWMLSLSAIFAALSLYTYQSEKVFTPIFMLILLLIYLKEFIKIPKTYKFLFFATGLLVILPMLFYISTNKESLLRAKATSIFANQTQLLQNNVVNLKIDKENKDVIGALLDNRRIEYTKTIIGNYISHYDLNWLIIKGDNIRHHAPNMGLLYLWELPFLLFGVYKFIFGDFDKKTKLFILSWFLIAPIPASITTGVPHALRTLNFLPTWQIFIAVGILFALQKISNIKYQISKIHIKYLIFTFYLLFFIFNFLYYLNQYFIQQNYFNASDWMYGWKEAANYVSVNQARYDKIIVTDKMPLDRGYMYFAFYLKLSPSEYQKYSLKESGGFDTTHYFGKYEFRPINWIEDSKNPTTLFVGNPNEFPNKDKALKIINFPNGSPSIYIVKN